MAKHTTTTSRRIFISYRPQETSDLAGRLYDQLADRFGAAHVLMDADAIESAVDTCDVLLAVIGHQWLTMTDGGGRRRLDDPDDIVRVELEAALERDIRVIPVLLDDAPRPRAQDLPDGLASLTRCEAIPVRHDTFRQDADRLADVIEKAFPERATAVLVDHRLPGQYAWQLSVLAGALCAALGFPLFYAPSIFRYALAMALLIGLISGLWVWTELRMSREGSQQRLWRVFVLLFVLPWVATHVTRTALPLSVPIAATLFALARRMWSIRDADAANASHT